MLNPFKNNVTGFSRYLAYLCVLCVIVLLNGCSHTRKDGPPDYYVDETKIPNAVPKVEPLSKYGNMDHYTVFGRRYYVLRTSKNYEEQGVASWYGTKFHAHHTSSGERYNMLAMTAAHKTLPLPTYVQVTNLKNGKQVIVKVNDRGPFESNRLIDLSYVAAKKLGMIGHGTTYVDVKAIDPRDAFSRPELFAKNTSPMQPQARKPIKHHYLYTESQPSKHDSKPPRRPAYARVKAGPGAGMDATLFLQVGSFHKKAQAEKLRKKLTALLATPVTIAPVAKIYHVQVGPFKDIVAADRASQRLRSMGLHSERIVEAFDITREL